MWEEGEGRHEECGSTVKECGSKVEEECRSKVGEECGPWERGVGGM